MQANDATDQMMAKGIMSNDMTANGMRNIMDNEGATSGMPVPGTNTSEHVIMNEHDAHQIKSGP